MMNELSKKNEKESQMYVLFNQVTDGLINGVIGFGIESLKDKYKKNQDIREFFDSVKKTTSSFLMRINNVEKDFVFNSNIATQLSEIIQTIDYLFDKNNKGYNQPITVLMGGAPGTGKTETMRYLVSKIIKKAENNAVVIVMNATHLTSMSDDRASSVIDTITYDCIEKLKKGKNVIMAIDEIDSLFSVNKSQKEMRSKVLVAFLFALNEIRVCCDKKSTKGRFFFFGTTNYVGAMDEAFSRRFQFFIPFSLPNAMQKFNIYKTYLSSLSKRYNITPNISEKDMEFFASSESILAPADIETITIRTFNQAIISKSEEFSRKEFFFNLCDIVKKTMYFQGVDSASIESKMQKMAIEFEQYEAQKTS